MPHILIPYGQAAQQRNNVSTAVSAAYWRLIGCPQEHPMHSMHPIRFIYILNGQPGPSTFSTRNAAYTAALLHAGSVIASITTVGIQAMDSIKGIA